jgi:RNA polymerase sigma-70 factor (ECF subfamily)
MNQFQNKARALPAVSASHQCGFTTLFEKHFQSLLEKTRYYVKDLEAAKDIVQGTFAKVWDKQTHLENLDDIRGYLEKACINSALNYIRDHRRFVGSVPQRVAGESESPHAMLAYAEMHDGLMNFIHSLPDRMRAAFLLSRFQNMTHREISKNCKEWIETVLIFCPVVGVKSAKGHDGPATCNAGVAGAAIGKLSIWLSWSVFGWIKEKGSRRSPFLFASERFEKSPQTQRYQIADTCPHRRKDSGMNDIVSLNHDRREQRASRRSRQCVVGVAHAMFYLLDEIGWRRSASHLTRDYLHQ